MVGTCNPARTGRQTAAVAPLDLIQLRSLLERGRGDPAVQIGLIDGPVWMEHPQLAPSIRSRPGTAATCRLAGGAACWHGTFVAGVLSAVPGSGAPAICPGCTLFVRPIFTEEPPLASPQATAHDLARAIVDCVDEGCRVVNISAAVASTGEPVDEDLAGAVQHAARNEVVVVAAAGNDGALGCSALIRHPWVLPVVAYTLSGAAMPSSNLGHAIGRRGLGAPGEGVVSLTPGGGVAQFAGTSAAAPFVSGTVALLCSQFPHATGATVRAAVQASAGPRRSIVPPLLNASAAYRILTAMSER
jgi:subtilisin family serine protease